MLDKKTLLRSLKLEEALNNISPSPDESDDGPMTLVDVGVCVSHIEGAEKAVADALAELDSPRTALATAERERDEARKSGCDLLPGLFALRAELAEAKRLRSEAISSHRSREDEIERMQKRVATAELERDAAIAERDARPDITAAECDAIANKTLRVGVPEEAFAEATSRGWAALRAHATKHRTESEG